MLSLLFLWHMHQPNYVNGLTKTAVMPWVRLHGVKGYLDMIDVAREYPEVKVNFNFAPILLKQIEDLVQKKIVDLWEMWSRKAAALLSQEEKLQILENFFKIHHENCILPYPRYRQLLHKRGVKRDPASLRQAVGVFSDQDFLDLQVWYNLAWCGFSAQKRYPELVALKQKGEDFTEEEKARVLNIHGEILAQVMGLYRQAMEAGHIELTTTPFYHPIMPLVYDTDFAKRAMPGRQLPKRFFAPEDVLAQLRLAQEQHERIFGKRARGLWPSEGSMAPEILPLLKQVGIEYFCTDEDMLFASLKNDPAWRQKPMDHLELFQGWVCEYQGAQIKAFFRERPLSDFIGFSAARSSAEEASNYLIHHIEHIASVAPKPQGALLIALDGENEWEAFPDGGESFLHAFYRKLSQTPHAKALRLGDYIDRGYQLPVTTTLHTGSWIGGNFDIWIGDEEENDAWNALGEVREFLVEQQQQAQANPQIVERAWREIYAAEGSDWFWWYGPDFESETDLLFDELFRTHLQNIYRLFHVEPPASLSLPICRPPVLALIKKPFDFIFPRMDGLGLGFFDWLGAGCMDVSQQQGTAMFAFERSLKQIWYGFNAQKLFFRLDFMSKLPGKMILRLDEPSVWRVVIEGKHATLEEWRDGAYIPCVATASNPLQIAVKKDIEIGIPLQVLGWQHNGGKVKFSVHIIEQALERESYPQRGSFEFFLPTQRFKLENWFV